MSKSKKDVIEDTTLSSPLIYETDKKDEFYDLIEKQGSFGKFQYLAYLTIMFGMNTTGYMQYQAAYLLLYPKFDCFTPDQNGNFVVPIAEDSS